MKKGLVVVELTPMQLDWLVGKNPEQREAVIQYVRDNVDMKEEYLKRTVRQSVSFTDF